MQGGAGDEAGTAREARDVDDTVRSVITWVDPTPAVAGPLAGVRVGVKDNIEIAGVRSTCASAFFADRVATTDAAVVTRLRAAGAQITATLNMAEFAVGVTSQNSAAGGPRNPWDPTRVPGGSSGGSAAAVAAGLVDVALGTDTGGSIRLPASACGVVGLRPSLGLIDTAGVFPVSSSFDTVGPLARSVEQVKAVFDVLAPSADVPLPDSLRIAMPVPFITDDVDPAILAAVADTGRMLDDMGHSVIHDPLVGMEDAQDIVYTIVYADLADLHRSRLRDHPELFQAATRARILQGLSISAAAREQALGRRDLFRAAMREYFTGVDVVLTPTLPVDVPHIAGGDDVIGQSRLMGRLSYPWSLHDGPTLSVPVGRHPGSGMPIGAQLTAAHGRESLLFAVAQSLQDRMAWHRMSPSLRVGRVR